MTLEELMSEPPGGHNHGRQRSQSGGWTPLETEDSETKSYKKHPTQRDHGTLAKYVIGKCRCIDCRKAMADWKRGRREKDSNSL